MIFRDRSVAKLVMRAIKFMSQVTVNFFLTENLLPVSINSLSTILTFLFLLLVFSLLQFLGSKHAQDIELDRFHGNSKEAIQGAAFHLGALAIIFILFALFLNFSRVILFLAFAFDILSPHARYAMEQR